MTRPLDIVCIGGGPGSLYFALLVKKTDARHRVRVIERNRPDDTFGFGVVFSDATMAGIAEADSEAYRCIAKHLVHWDDIDVHYRGQVLRSTGHGFSGMSRHTLLRVLQEQAGDAGVELQFESEVASLAPFADADLVVAGDGANSTVRRLVQDRIDITTDVRPNRFVWLGTAKPFPAFTFYFKRNEHGLWRVHAYQYEPGFSTFIVECRDETWRAAGLDRATEHETSVFLEALFAEELAGHRLITNRSIWRQFPTIRTTPWSTGHVVLIGDAAHTAHFSVGSGTRMAMEDAVALRTALLGVAAATERRDAIALALRAYEEQRRPQVESLQRAAQASLEWFEDTERYVCQPPLQFAFTLLTRSLRITHEDLRARDPEFLARVDQWVAEEAARQVQRQPRSVGGLKAGRHEHRARPAADVHAVPAPRPRDSESRGRVADVPVRGGQRHGRRLASRAPGQPRHRRCGSRHGGDDRCLRGWRVSRRGARGSIDQSTPPRGSASWSSCIARARRRSASSSGTLAARAPPNACGKATASRCRKADGRSYRRRPCPTSRTGARCRAR